MFAANAKFPCNSEQLHAAMFMFACQHSVEHMTVTLTTTLADKQHHSSCYSQAMISQHS